MDSRIFSSNTKKCLNVIISVLSNANRCCLYPTTIDTEKTIFNYYLIEIIPILNKFYEKDIDIELPKALEDLVSQVKLKIEQNIDNKIFDICFLLIPNFSFLFFKASIHIFIYN